MKECVDCLYSEVVDWDQDPETGKATLHYWCEKHEHCCYDILECDNLDTGDDIRPVDLNKEALKEESELWHHC